jgi:dihydroxyacetone kinase
MLKIYLRTRINSPFKDKVGIVTGGGSGHKPAFIGFTGEADWEKGASGISIQGQLPCTLSYQHFSALLMKLQLLTKVL